MRKLFAKILLWFLATMVITAAGFILIDFFGFSGSAASQRRSAQFFLAEARHIYEKEGREGLSGYLQRIEMGPAVRAFLVDPHGHDVQSGADRTDLMAKVNGARMPFVRHDSSFFFYVTDSDGFCFFMEPEVGSLWVQRSWLLVAIVALCYVLARHLTAPLRGLQHAVESFGKGDFRARSSSHRRDELGQLARTFDRMAERIQTLVERQRVLLRDISHELRSPLTRLGLAVELARSRPDKETALNTIDREVDRLNMLVGEVLSLARLDSHEPVLQRSSMRLDEMLEDLVDACSVEAEERHCSLIYRPGSLIMIDANEELVRRALENVVRNAVRYAPEKTDVTVTAEQSQGMTTIRIRDAGPGVPEESLTRIFEPFYRVDHDRNRETGGTGLGLAIALRAVESHGGSILARNIHPGLEIEIRLPAASL
jgi:two-component system, OmpR family, sensor kinase